MTKTEQREQELTEAYGYLSRLLLRLAPQCEVQPNLIGVCTQLDNAIAGLQRQIGDLGAGDAGTQVVNADMAQTLGEPVIHSHITDLLPDDHPLAFEAVDCVVCGGVLHLGNECMQTWVETGKGNYCLKCFYEETVDVIADAYGLRRGDLK